MFWSGVPFFFFKIQVQTGRKSYSFLVQNVTYFQLTVLEAKESWFWSGVNIRSTVSVTESYGIVYMDLNS